MCGFTRSFACCALYYSVWVCRNASLEHAPTKKNHVLYMTTNMSELNVIYASYHTYCRCICASPLLWRVGSDCSDLRFDSANAGPVLPHPPGIRCSDRKGVVRIWVQVPRYRKDLKFVHLSVRVCVCAIIRLTVCVCMRAPLSMYVCLRCKYAKYARTRVYSCPWIHQWIYPSLALTSKTFMTITPQLPCRPIRTRHGAHTKFRRTFSRFSSVPGLCVPDSDPISHVIWVQREHSFVPSRPRTFQSIRNVLRKLL